MTDDKDSKEEELKDEDIKEEDMASFSDLFRFAGGCDWSSMIIGALASFTVGAMQPTSAILFGDIMDITGGPQAMQSAVDEVLYKMCALGGINFICAWAGHSFFKTSGLRQSAEWRKSYLNAIVRQDVGWYDVNKPAQLSSQISSATQQLEDGISSKMANGIRFLGQGVVGLIICYTYSWQMGLVLLVLMPLVGFSVWFLTKVTTESAGEMNAAYGRAGGLAMECISGLRTVSALGMQQDQVDRYYANLEQAHDAGVRKSWRLGLASGLMFASGNFMTAAGFAFGTWKIAQQLEDTAITVGTGANATTVNCGSPTTAACDLTGGDILIAMFTLQIGAQGLGGIGPWLTSMAKARKAAKDIMKVVDRIPPIDSHSEEGLQPDKCTGGIIFRDVHFTYPSRPDTKVMDGYNLTVDAGTTVALVGASGSGKSTAIQLVERFYDPESGSVTLDGLDLKDLNVKWLREQIGLVGQEPVLFGGTVAENIAYALPNATQAQIEMAAKSANAHDFIMEFEKGYETDVGEKGGQLSGGQKQRVAIARAIIKDPKILLLDEATSALDTTSERVVQEALDSLMTKTRRTTIVVAHRLSTIRNADKIAVVDAGRIVEEGTYDDLMAIGSEGWFHKLAQAAKKREEQDVKGSDTPEGTPVSPDRSCLPSLPGVPSAPGTPASPGADGIELAEIGAASAEALAGAKESGKEGKEEEELEDYSGRVYAMHENEDPNSNSNSNSNPSPSPKP